MCFIQALSALCTFSLPLDMRQRQVIKVIKSNKSMENRKQDSPKFNLSFNYIYIYIFEFNIQIKMWKTYCDYLLENKVVLFF